MKEIVLCAAIWYIDIPIKREIPSSLLRPKNIDKGLVFCGHRHPHCMYTMVAFTGYKSIESGVDAVGKYIQGFLTNTNRFVDRLEGAKIALLSGQIEKLNYEPELFSEDLY